MHESRMKMAVMEAEKALEKGEVPVGCVIYYGDKIIAKAHNLTETLKDPTAHAEMQCITSASEYLDSKVLKGCSVYVTLEPCPMCAGALVLAKVDYIYFGAYDSKSGACGSVINIADNNNLNHKCTVYGGILDFACSGLLKQFFKDKRTG
jgi:tRNA(adenine34) deaminase